ncbi:hypothetical protein [Sphaerochaeta sp. PS]|uniref:hypothetical protein n=1 Tax=Sphaerochaeta sp. PS TaxID=3076336 RepID=UPI0028A46AD3|nr:hypothetical protein [Sphaerochaeta sp. PS]MDT4761990.1 hypothetical protein [Sphaerochaeta sp. PS]
MLLFSLSSLYANATTVYPVDTPVYQALRQLYTIEGLAMPSSAGPWSGDELLMMLHRLDGYALSPASRATYQYALTILSETKPSFSLGATVAVEGYLHTNTTNYTSDDDWKYNHASRRPLLSVPLEIVVSQHFYSFAEFSLTAGKYDGGNSPTSGASSLYGESTFTNSLQGLTQLDANIPYRAFSAWGGEGWLLEVGRDKLSWGPGMTGNFMLGDHVQYHNQGRFTAYGDTFKFTFVTSFFPHPDEIWETDVPGGYRQGRPLKGLKMFMGHRLEWRLFGGKVGFVLSEGLMYQPKNGALDLRVLNPMMLYHNYFIRSDTNSIASMEMDVAIIPHWNMYAQFAVDELAFGSVERNLTSGRHPDGLGYMLGLAYASPLSKGILYGSLEGVYTDPYLYLRSVDGNTSQTDSDWLDSLNFVVALRRWFSDQLIYDQEFLGYRNGGDAIVGNLEVGYKEYGAWSVKGTLFYMAHGAMALDSPWKLDMPKRTPSGSVTHYIDAGISGSTSFSEGWEAHAGLDLLARIADWTPTYDIQLYMGVGYTF